MRSSLSFLVGIFSAAALTSVACFPIQAATTQSSNLKGNPSLQSASALVADDQGNVIYGKDLDTIRPIASLTKLMTAMVVIDGGQALDEKLVVTKEDRDSIKHTGSRLAYGARLSRRDLLLLAIMSSENRAAAVLGRNWPGGTAAFVKQMNLKARELGMGNSRFADPAGLDPGNSSTARDVGKMVIAAQAYDLIRQASTTKSKEVRPFPDRGPITYVNTNRLLKNANWDISLSKTGYLNESGRCLVMQTKISGKAVYIVLLNSFGKLTPFGDSNRLRKWMTAQN
ncbi:MAG TPA: serine hydrolase [Xanthomonadales bacterium]|nr:serine hydrolase [Xanthomonadales bacterium]